MSTCTCRRGLPPLHGGYKPLPECPAHPKVRITPPKPPTGSGAGSK